MIRRDSFDPSTRIRLELLIAVGAAALAGCVVAHPPAEAPRSQAPTEEVRPFIGVALGGGGARGFAEIGVLRVLEQERIPIDIVTGTSVGSLIGALFADTGSVLDAEFLAIQVEEEDLFDYRAFAVLSGGLVRGERLEAFLAAHLKHTSIEDMKVRFAAVATELRTGETRAFHSGPVARAVHASAAIPGVFVPVEIDGRVYVDGGVTNPVPVDVARQMGADVVIAVAIPAAIPESTPRNPLAIAYHAATIMAVEIGRLRAREADVLIAPDVGDVAYDDFTQKKRLIAAGEAAARAALPAIHAAIAAKTRHRPIS